ncbi:MAG: STAS domain-containing protein [Pirellulales bacterium]|nr:STAS domain-containing protein [Pirellulales bacterium]
MALIRNELKGEIRLVIIDEARLMETATIEQCYREIADLLDKAEEGHVLIHFGRVTFMSSSALGMLIRVHKKCKEYKIALKLCNIAPTIRQVFKITAIDKILDIYDDSSQALEAFQKSGGLFFRKKKPSSYEVT